jgi:small subunit ribosomal protein S20
VANHPSAEKRNRQRVKRTIRNRSVKSSVRSLVKRVRAELTAKNKEAAKTALAVAISSLDKAASKRVLHSKAVSRTVARLSAALHKLEKAG